METAGGRNAPGELLRRLRTEQRARGHVPRRVLAGMARNLGVSLGRAWEVATFYEEIQPGDSPVTVIRLCAGPACHLAGSPALLAALERVLGSQPACTGRAVRVERGSCQGQCDRAPALMIGERVHVRVKEGDLPRLVRLDGEEAREHGRNGGGAPGKAGSEPA